MPTLIQDVPDGSNVGQDTIHFTAVRVFYVRELNAGDAQANLKQALDFPGVPQRGDAHPSINLLFVKTRIAEPVSVGSEHARVTVTYGVPSFAELPPDDTADGTIEIGGTVSLIEAELDRDGDPMIVQHTFTEKDDDGNETTRTEYQHAQVDIQIPQLIYSVSRKENSHPLIKARRFLGKVNNNPFFGDPAGTWLCTRLDGTSDDNGASYQVFYEFQHKPDGWNITVIFIDPETGRPPVDPATGLSALVDGEGRKDFDVYEADDFGDLGV